MSDDFISAAAPDSKLPAPSAKKALSASSTAAKGVIISVSTAMIAAVITIAALYGNFKGARAEDREVTYNLAVEEVKWDFAQTGRDVCTNTLLGESSSASTFTVNDPAAALIGSKYWRRQFVAYASPDFQTARTIPGEWSHLGSLGPVLRVQAGETLRVRLRNKSRFPASFSVHGLSLSSLTLFDDASPEGPVGAPSSASTGGKGSGTVATTILQLLGLSTSSTNATLYDSFSGGYRTVSCSSVDDRRGVCAQAGHAGAEGEVGHSVVVQPGKTMEYAFAVPHEAGPAPGETSSVARLYQSLSYQGHDVGLTGFLVITPPATAATTTPSPASTGTGTPLSARTRPADVTHEVAQLYSVNNENDSPYLGLNLLEFVYRGRVASRLPALRPSATPVEQAAAQERAAVYPLHSTTSVHHVIAALYNQAAAQNASVAVASIEASDPAILALLGTPVGTPLPRPTVLRVHTLRGLPLPLEVHPADPARSNLHLLDARGYVSLYGQVAAELAIEWTMLPGLQSEASWDQGRFTESNFMHAVNGKVYCNVGSLSFPFGATVRWYTAVVGTEVDIHSVHWHGNTLLLHGHRTDSIQLLPRQVVTADMYAHSPGTWLLHCHVVDHIHAGMVLLYTVQAAGSSTSVRLPLPGGSAGSATTEERVPSLIASSLSGRLREYWVAAEVVQWPYVGAHIIDHHGTPGPPCNGVPYHALATAINGSYTWTKVVYRGYTDGTYSTRVPRSAEWEHLGILGPVLRAEVGDIVKVHFKNNGGQPFSMHPHGVAYPKSGEGAPYQDGTWSNPADTGDDVVLPGASWTYTWWVPESAGPGPSDPSSVPWLYHGHVHEVKDENTGMIGVILVTARGAARVPGGVGDELRPADVDRELVVLSKVFDEGRASGAPIVHIHRRERELGAHVSGGQYDKFYTVNGKAGCSLSGMNATSGQRVRWYMTSLGNEIDLHHMSVTGHTMTQWGRRVTGVALSPGTMFAVDMVAGVPGDWLLTSNVRAHVAQGLVSTFRVEGPPPPGAAAAAPSSLPLAGDAQQSRTYYLAAENVTWDYTPAGEDRCAPAEARTGAEAPFFAPLDAGAVNAWGVGRYDRAGTDLAAFPTDGRIFVGQGLEDGTTIGRFYHKAVYVGYSDDTFTTVTYRPGDRPLNASLRGTGPADASTGILGPTLRAAVGDTLVVVFHNRMLTAVNFNIPYGPVLIAVSLRAPGNMTWGPVPGTAGATVSSAAHYALPPGWTARYTYSIPPTAGPGPADASTVAWEYKSTARLNHLHAGLVGGVLVAASPAALLPAAGTHGAHREYILAWYISNENESPYLARNIQDRVANRAGLSTTADAFVESNLKHAVNGRLFCNLEGLTARVGETVRLHLLGLGALLDMHTPQAHGQLLRVSKGRDGSTGATLTQYTTAAVGQHPGVMQTVDVTAAGAGSWLVECGVNDHWQAGMRASLLVTE